MIRKVFGYVCLCFVPVIESRSDKYQLLSKKLHQVKWQLESNTFLTYIIFIKETDNHKTNTKVIFTMYTCKWSVYMIAYTNAIC